MTNAAKVINKKKSGEVVEVNKEEETIKAEAPSYEELLEQNKKLQAQLEEVKSASGGRKKQVLDYMRQNGHVKVSDMAAFLKITDRNVSSQMTYLRKDGVNIATDSRGYKFIENLDELESLPKLKKANLV